MISPIMEYGAWMVVYADVLDLVAYMVYGTIDIISDRGLTGVSCIE